MTGLDVLISIACGLAVNECCEVSPWLARRLAGWAAQVRYRDEPERLTVRLEEVNSVACQPAGKLTRLVVALSFVGAAIAYRVKLKAREPRLYRPVADPCLRESLMYSLAPLALTQASGLVQLPYWLLLGLPAFVAAGTSYGLRRRRRRAFADCVSRLVTAKRLTAPESRRLIRSYSGTLNLDDLALLMSAQMAEWELWRRPPVHPAWPRED